MEMWALTKWSDPERSQWLQILKKHLVQNRNHPENKCEPFFHTRKCMKCPLWDGECSLQHNNSKGLTLQDQMCYLRRNAVPCPPPPPSHPCSLYTALHLLPCSACKHRKRNVFLVFTHTSMLNYLQRDWSGHGVRHCLLGVKDFASSLWMLTAQFSLLQWVHILLLLKAIKAFLPHLLCTQHAPQQLWDGS